MPAPARLINSRRVDFIVRTTLGNTKGSLASVVNSTRVLAQVVDTLNFGARDDDTGRVDPDARNLASLVLAVGNPARGFHSLL
jgi:hypothetical protein